MEEIDQNIEQINQNIQTLNLILGGCGDMGPARAPDLVYTSFVPRL